MAINSIANLTDSTVAGSNTQIQYNNSGVFGASSNLTFDGSTLAVTGALTVSGDITSSTAPAFMAYNDTTRSNVTGDGTVYTLPYNNETFDRGSDYNNSTYTFTAPVAGAYQFHMQVYITGNNGTIMEARITTSNEDAYYEHHTVSHDAIQMSSIFYMDAADTCVFKVKVGGGTKVSDVYGASAVYVTMASGALIS